MTEQDIAADVVRRTLIERDPPACPQPDASWRFDLWCMAACLAIVAVTFLAIYLKTGRI
jgi:hypothetical protein